MSLLPVLEKKGNSLGSQPNQAQDMYPKNPIGCEETMFLPLEYIHDFQIRRDDFTHEEKDEGQK